MLGSNYWNGDTSLLFGAEHQAPVSSRCSPKSPDIAPARPAAPPNSAWYHAEAGLRGGRCCLHFARILQASSIYKNTTLHSSGRSHAYGMASQLPYGFIAQQCSVLAPFSLTVLFIANAAPQAAGEVMTLSPRDTGTYKPVHH
jgi:hypothetical protein